MSILIKGMEIALEGLNTPLKIKVLFDEVPAADVKPVVHGEWKESKKITLFPNDIIWVCSVCGEYYAKHSSYCPNCGAKMGG